jgi:hypothetical protein
VLVKAKGHSGKRTWWALVVVAAVAGSASGVSPVAAQPVSKEVRKACVGDYKRLCPSYKPNTPQMRACMEANALSLSSACIDALVDSGEVDRKSVKAGRR